MGTLIERQSPISSRFAMHKTLVALMLVACLPIAVSQAADWNSFRGPAGDGVALEEKAPTKWSAEENVVWKISLPQPGNSSPIVSKGRVFLTCAEDKDG